MRARPSAWSTGPGLTSPSFRARRFGSSVDASGHIDFGAIANEKIVAGLWAEEAAEKSIGWKELAPVRLMLELLAPTLAPGTIIIVTTDNSGNAFSLNSGNAHSPELFDQLVPIV